MSRRIRKEIEVEARRRFIVDTTRRLLAEHDIEHISMDKIAAAASYTRRTLYSYFKSRDEILLSVLHEDLGLRWRDQQRDVAHAESGLSKIQAWAVSLFEFSCSHPESVRLQAFWDYKGITEESIGRDLWLSFEELNNELANGLREIFAVGIADGSLRADLSIDMCISQFLYGTRVVIHRSLSPTYSFASFEARPYFDHFLDLFSRGIQA